MLTTQKQITVIFITLSILLTACEREPSPPTATAPSTTATSPTSVATLMPASNYPKTEKWEYIAFNAFHKLRLSDNSVEESYELRTPSDVQEFSNIADAIRSLKIPMRRDDWEKNPTSTDLLNTLGSQGWELVNRTDVMTQTGGLLDRVQYHFQVWTRESWTLKRRVY